MVFRPRVFVSAASPELDAFREVVKKTLRDLGADPVEHTDSSIPYGPLDGVLKVAIASCEAVIHLAGSAFGPEPAERTHGASRRSFAQYEFDVAKTLQRRVFSFLATKAAQTAPCNRGDAEALALQAEHRRAIEGSPDHWEFSTPEELSQQLRALRSRIIVRRRYARLPIPVQGRRLHGRELVLSELRELIVPSRVVILEPPAKFAAVSASAGKTLVGIEAGWRLFDSGRFDFVLWVPTPSGSDLEAELALLTHMDALALVQDEITGQHARLESLRRWLRSEDQANKVLVIFDGVEDELTWLAVERVLPWFAGAAVVITTQLTRPIPNAERVSIGAISTDASVNLLASHIFGGEPAPLVQQSLAMLAGTLGHQPLALQIAGRTIADSRETPEQFLASLPQRETKGAEDRSPRVARWVPAIIQVVRKSVRRLDPLARGFLYALTCLAPQPAGIPQAIFVGRQDVAQTRTALAQLERLGLITIGDDGQTLFVHEVVREALRENLSADELNAALEAARVLLENAFQRADRASGSAAVRTRLVPHCRRLLAQLIGHSSELKAGRLARNLAGWLKDTGRLSEAEHFQRRALRIAERACPAGHPDLVPDLRLLAAILQDRRRFDESAQRHREAIDILTGQPSSRSGELVIELFALAGCLRAANRLGEAEPVLREAVEIEERASGRMHPRTAIALHVLAGLLEILHRPKEAVPLYRRALQIDEQLPVCPPARLAARLHNLAGALANAGERHEAIALHERAIGIDERVYGAGHDELVAPLKQLAGLLELENRLSEAADRLRRVLAIEEAERPTSPLEIASTLTSLASVLRRKGEWKEVGAICRRAIGLLDQSPKWNPLVAALRSECEAMLKGPAAAA